MPSLENQIFRKKFIAILIQSKKVESCTTFNGWNVNESCNLCIFSNFEVNSVFVKMLIQ